MTKKLIACLALFAVLTLGASAAPAAAKTVVIKIASIAPARSPWGKALEAVARDWEKISNGTVQVRIFADNVAGGEQDMIRKIRMGTIQGGVFSNMGLAKIESSITAISIPFLFHSREEFNVVFDRMKPIFEEMLEKKGFKPILWTLAGWINFFTKKEVIDPDGLKKLKVSVTADFAEVEQVWKKMGYEVVPGDMNDLMIQLQSGAVSAIYLPALLAGSGQFFALVPHMLSPSLAPLIGGLLLSDKAWASIPEELHQPLLEAVTDASRGLYEETMSLEADAVKMMMDNGLKVHDPPAADLAKWREAAGLAVQDLIGPVFSKEIYDRILAYIQEYRKSRGQ